MTGSTILVVDPPVVHIDPPVDDPSGGFNPGGSVHVPPVIGGHPAYHAAATGDATALLIVGAIVFVIVALILLSWFWHSLATNQ